jgi:CRISPR-associated endonuclease/helicase Cas3
MKPYAHTHPAFPEASHAAEHWEPLFTPFGDTAESCQGRDCPKCRELLPQHGHLNKVAWWTAEYAARMFPEGSKDAELAREWGYLAGLWHDVGKGIPEVQRMLEGESIRVEHSGAGAALAKKLIPGWWETLGFVIAGHHAGLTNRTAPDSPTPLDHRAQRAEDALKKCSRWMSEWYGEPAGPLFRMEQTPDMPEWISCGDENSAFRWSCFIRMIFSALVDADSIATESFCCDLKGRAALRAQPLYDSIPALRARLDGWLDQLGNGAEDTELNRRRGEILGQCRAAAPSVPGFFALNVPTGGGKTLAGMSFALNHAERHYERGMRRVIVAVPYTSIIEQNAGIYQQALGAGNVIEHHSNLDDFNDEEEIAEAKIRQRMACENWDAPVIVTTNVQLFESLFTHRRSRARKLHHIAGSVIILDEAQCVPLGFMDLIVPMLRELTEHYGCSVVICTATQPAWRQRRGKPAFGIPEEKWRLILTDGDSLAQAECFDRVAIEWPKSKEPIPYEILAARLATEPCVMSIVHRKKDAQFLAKKLKELRPDERVFHLSTYMCPAHRRHVLAEIRQAVADYHHSGERCRIVSTQLVEAGVDLDLPVVYRAMAGLDSIAQAAGRCNREGRLKEKGRMVVFHAETKPPVPLLEQCAGITAAMLKEYKEALSIRDAECFEVFFRTLYHHFKSDSNNLFRHVEDRNFELLGKGFCMIDKDDQVSVVIPYDDEAIARLEKIRVISKNPASEAAATRLAFRALQPYTVQVWERGVTALRGALEPLFPGSSTMVLNMNLHPDSYDMTYGLMVDDEPFIPPENLIVS